MLRRVRIDGYKALRGADLALNRDGLTVLLGPNGAGKTSVFGAIGLADRLTTEGALSELKHSFARLVSKGDPKGLVALGVEVDSAQGPLEWLVELALEGPYGQVRANEVFRRGNTILAKNAAGKVTGENGMLTSLVLPGDQTLAALPEGRWSAFEPVRTAISSAIHPTRLVSLNPSAVAEPAEVGTQVLSTGAGLPAALNQLSSTRRKIFIEIEAKFREFFPWVEEIEVPAERRDVATRNLVAEPSGDWSVPYGSPGVIGASGPITGATGPLGPVRLSESLVQLRFRENGTSTAFHASEMASGMLLSLALLWLVMRPDPDSVLCYDEPENSIHPYLLKQVYGMLRQAARGELSRPPTRVLVATHSVDFVNLCEPEEVFVCERKSDRVQISPVSGRKELDEVIAEYRGAIGELWHSGALGGVPRVPSDSDSR